MKKFRLDCFSDKHTNSEISTGIGNVLKQAPDRKDCSGRKSETPSIFIMNENRESNGEDGNRSYRESTGSKISQRFISSFLSVHK